MALWYNNDNFGSEELLNALQNSLDVIEILAKYFKIYSLGLMPVFGYVVTEILKFFCYEILKQLPEFESSTGPERRSTTNYVRDTVTKNQKVTDTKLTHYFPNNSLGNFNKKNCRNSKINCKFIYSQRKRLKCHHQLKENQGYNTFEVNGQNPDIKANNSTTGVDEKNLTQDSNYNTVKKHVSDVSGIQHEIKHFTSAECLEKSEPNRSNKRVSDTKELVFLVSEAYIETNRVALFENVFPYIKTRLFSMPIITDFYDQDDIHGLYFLSHIKNKKLGKKRLIF
ncbi:unnamed protein product [Cunninghamella blakesleeana]